MIIIKFQQLSISHCNSMGHMHGPEALNTLYQATIEGTRGRAHQKLPTGLD
jgi:hypothetical protein